MDVSIRNNWLYYQIWAELTYTEVWSTQRPGMNNRTVDVQMSSMMLMPLVSSEISYVAVDNHDAHTIPYITYQENQSGIIFLV